MGPMIRGATIRPHEGQLGASTRGKKASSWGQQWDIYEGQQCVLLRGQRCVLTRGNNTISWGAMMRLQGEQQCFLHGGQLGASTGRAVLRCTLTRSNDASSCHWSFFFHFSSISVIWLIQKRKIGYQPTDGPTDGLTSLLIETRERI